MRALGFEPKKEEIKKMIAEIDKEGTGESQIFSQREKTFLETYRVTNKDASNEQASVLNTFHHCN